MARHQSDTRVTNSLRSRVALFLLPCLTMALGGGADVWAQSAENVAVVINTASAASLQVGEHYARVRGIPTANVIRIQTSTGDAVSRAAYASTIEAPIAAALGTQRLHDRVLYLVLTKGLPLRITGTTGQEGTQSGVDSELTLLYRRMTGQAVLTRGRVDNPYFLGTRPTKDAQPFTHREHDVFLVSRLDGFTVEDAIALIDRAQAPSTSGRIVLDQRDALVNRTGDEWLEAASQRLVAEGHADRQMLEMTPKPARDVSPVIGYYSWGSTDPMNRVRRVGLGFAPGALAATFVSTDARTFEEPPANWVPTDDANRATWFAGSPQSLTGDLIREGLTGVAGQVSEPYLQSAVRPEILFAAYLAGFNLVESFYLAIPHLSWQTVVIGDPLCAPFRRKMLLRNEIEEGIDGETELPALFAKRRMSLLLTAQKGVPQAAVALLVKSESRSLRSDLAGARLALERAVELAPESPVLHLQLGVLLQRLKEQAASEAAYRKVLALQPRNAVALNNLAYNLAVFKNEPAEGLPLAQQAVALAPGEPNVVDTLAWIHHLMGNDAEAAGLLAAALKVAPGSAEIRLHAAVVFAARGAQAVSETELTEALRLDPSLEQTDEVRRLRVRLDELSSPR